MGKLSIDVDRCKGCGLCVDACPKHVLELDKSTINKNGYHPVHLINEAECISCASCARMCPDLVFIVRKL